MSAEKRCLRVADDGTQCHWLDWCPVHGDVDQYEAPAVPQGILTSDDLSEWRA